MTGADQDTFRLALVAWARVGGENPSGAKKEESMLRRRQEEGAGEYKNMEEVSR